MSAIKKYAERKNIPSVRIVASKKLYFNLKRIQKLLNDRGKKKYGKNFNVTLIAATEAAAERMEELLDKKVF